MYAALKAAPNGAPMGSEHPLNASQANGSAQEKLPRAAQRPQRSGWAGCRRARLRSAVGAGRFATATLCGGRVATAALCGGRRLWRRAAMLLTVFCLRRDRSELTFSLQVDADFELQNFRALCELESGIPAAESQVGARFPRAALSRGCAASARGPSCLWRAAVPRGGARPSGPRIPGVRKAGPAAGSSPPSPLSRERFEAFPRFLGAVEAAVDTALLPHAGSRIAPGAGLTELPGAGLRRAGGTPEGVSQSALCLLSQFARRRCAAGQGSVSSVALSRRAWQSL